MLPPPLPPIWYLPSATKPPYCPPPPPPHHPLYPSQVLYPWPAKSWSLLLNPSPTFNINNSPFSSESLLIFNVANLAGLCGGTTEGIVTRSGPCHSSITSEQVMLGQHWGGGGGEEKHWGGGSETVVSVHHQIMYNVSAVYCICCIMYMSYNVSVIQVVV